MNIYEAFNKLKENPNLIIKHKAYKYIQRSGTFFCYKINKSINDIHTEGMIFYLDEILSNDWEILEE